MKPRDFDLPTDLRSAPAGELAKYADLDWTIEARPLAALNGARATLVPKRVALVRSDTNAPIAVVNPSYRPVQPLEIIRSYQAFCANTGANLAQVGAARGGAIFWALAELPFGDSNFHGTDTVLPYLMFITGNTGQHATRVFLTTRRMACLNMLPAIFSSRDDGRRRSNITSIHHRSVVDFSRVQELLGRYSNEWRDMSSKIAQMARTPVTEPAARKFIDGLLSSVTPTYDPEQNTHHQRRREQLETIYHTAPGQELITAKNTVWGLVNAATYWVDHVRRSKSDDLRFESATLGTGARIKRLALDQAAALMVPA